MKKITEYNPRDIEKICGGMFLRAKYDNSILYKIESNSTIINNTISEYTLSPTESIITTPGSHWSYDLINDDFCNLEDVKAIEERLHFFYLGEKLDAIENSIEQKPRTRLGLIKASNEKR